MPTTEPVIENQFFVGVPWKGIRAKFESVISELKKQYPVHCVIFGRTTGQGADDLWQSIQREIRASAGTIFDVTDSNPNVALEFGYTEAIGKQRMLTQYERKPRKLPGKTQHASIMSDLAGKVRVPYKTEGSLKTALAREFDRNPYVVRFKQWAKTQRLGKREEKVAIAATHELAGGKRVKKPTLVLNLQSQFPNMTTVNVPDVINMMVKGKLLASKRGPRGGVAIPQVK